MRTTTTLTGLAGAAALVVGLAGPAVADREAQTDPTGDTVAVRVTGQAPSPAVRNADITRISTRHNAQRIEIEVDVVRLRAADWAFDFRYRTPEGQYSGYLVNEGGSQFATLFPILGRPQPGDQCQPLVGVDRERDRVSFSVPRFCLDNPAWVRTGAESAVPDGDRTRRDDARQRGGRSNGFDGITLGPRVDGPPPV